MSDVNEILDKATNVAIDATDRAHATGKQTGRVEAVQLMLDMALESRDMQIRLWVVQFAEIAKKKWGM